MTKKITLVYIILTVLLMQVALSQATQSNAINNYFSMDNASENNPSQKVFTPDAPPGTEVVKTNIFRDGACEEETSDGGPSGFNDYGTAFALANYSYQDEVHSGSYGAYISSRGSSQYHGSFYDSRYFEYIPERAYLDEGINMDLWFNVKANPDIAQGGYIRFYLRLSSNLGNYYMYYEISIQNVFGSNGTQQAYYDVRPPLNTWTHLTRNVTEDLIQAVTLLPDLSLTYIRYFYFECYSPSEATGDQVLLFDDVSFTNITSFNYFADNGDFEDGDSYPWTDDGYGPANCYLTEDDKTQGNSAMNMTVYSPYSYFNSYVYAEKELYTGWNSIPKGFVPKQSGDLVFSFDWKYSDMDNALGQQVAYFYVSFYNISYSSNIYYYLGDENDVVPASNYTASTYATYYLAADGLGSRNVWNHFSLDIYEITSIFNWTHLPTYYLGFYVEADQADDLTVQLLVDDFQMITYPAGEADFESGFDFNPSDPIRLWNTQNNENYVNLTSDAYSGNFAANVSSYGGSGTRYCSRRTFLPVTNNLYTDFWWRLDEISPAAFGNAYTFIRLQLDDSNLLYYILGSNGLTFVNQTTQCYYHVEDHNVTGIWNNLFRNLTADVAYFGAGIHNITEIYIGSYSDGPAKAITIFDDLHFATDVTEPMLGNLQHSPHPIEYNDDVTITVSAYDNIGIDEVFLHYQLNGASWTSLPMALYAPNQYEAIIPAQVYNTDVNYYVEAFDVYGHMNSIGGPDSYQVVDLTLPELEVDAPSELEDLSGEVLFNVTLAEDVGSGIDYFEIIIDGDVVYSGLVFPYTFVLNTLNYENGVYTISFNLKDNADNLKSEIFIYNIYNPPTNWEAFTAFMKQWGPYIGGGAGGLAIVVVVLVVVLRKKKGI